MTRKTIIGKIKPILINYKYKLLLFTILKVFLIIFTIVNPYFYKILVDDVMIDKNFNLLLLVILGYLVIFTLETFTLIIQRVLLNKTVYNITLNIKNKIWSNYLNMSIDKYETYTHGDLKNRIDHESDIFGDFIISQFIDYLYHIVSAISFCVVLFILNYKLAICGILMIPVSFVITKKIGEKANKLNSLYREEWSKYENFQFNAIRGWNEIKALDASKEQERIFENYWDILSDLFYRNHVYWFLNRSLIGFNDFFLTRMNIFFVGGLLIINNELTVGSLLVFMVYYKQFFSSINVINEKNLKLSEDLPIIDRVIEVYELDIEEKILLLDNDINHKLVFDNVSFSYSDEKKILNNVNFTIEENEFVAIVGQSGAGKTTIIKLLLGLYKVSSGSILIDEKNIDEINSVSLNSEISAVMQNSELLNMSIRENLLIAKTNSSQEELEKALKMANIYDFVMSLPDKLETTVGERGLKLSGGQLQRIAIARTLILNPKVIIFDESTSALDHESEKMIRSTIRNIANEKTVIVIAHRESSIADAERVIFLKNGTVIGDDSYQELIKHNLDFKSILKKND